MKKSYIDYAMSVIIGRAIPDVRDGLKPVHRRVLFAMHEMGNRWNKPIKNQPASSAISSASIIPTAMRRSMIRWSGWRRIFPCAISLIDGQGNFGSIDGDPPAAMRYTEVRMARIAEEMLADLEKETVDFIPNYDESLKEPIRSAVPRCPCCCSTASGGIAVGMATNIPPHNLREVIDGTIALINNPEITD